MDTVERGTFLIKDAVGMEAKPTRSGGDLAHKA